MPAIALLDTCAIPDTTILPFSPLPNDNPDALMRWNSAAEALNADVVFPASITSPAIDVCIITVAFPALIEPCKSKSEAVITTSPMVDTDLEADIVTMPSPGFS